MDSPTKVGLVFGVVVGISLIVGMLVESGKQKTEFNVLHAPSRPQEDEPGIVLSGWVEFNSENEHLLSLRVLVENNLKEVSIEDLAVRVNATGHLHGACWDGDRLQCNQDGGTAPNTLESGKSEIFGAEIQVQRSGIFPILADAEWTAGGAFGRAHAELGIYQLIFPQQSMLAAAYAALVALALPLLGFAGGWFLKVFSDRQADQQREREIHSRIEHEIFKHMFPVMRTAAKYCALIFQATGLLERHYNEKSQDEDCPKRILWAVLRLHKAMRIFSKELRQFTFRTRQGEIYAAHCWYTIVELLRGSYNEVKLGRASEKIKPQEKWEDFSARFQENPLFGLLSRETVVSIDNRNIKKLLLISKVLCALIDFEENYIMDPWYRPGEWHESPGDIDILQKVMQSLADSELDGIAGVSKWREEALRYYTGIYEKALAREGNAHPRKPLSLRHDANQADQAES